MAKLTDREKTLAMIRALYTNYRLPEWAVLDEVRGGTGYGNVGHVRDANPLDLTERRLDFVAIQTWPSKGLRLVVFEIKASRSDYQRELNSPQKRVLAESVSAQRYYVCPDGVIDPATLPEGWGLLEWHGHGDTLSEVIPAPIHEQPDLHCSFVASMVRQALCSDRATLWRTG